MFEESDDKRNEMTTGGNEASPSYSSIAKDLRFENLSCVLRLIQIVTKKAQSHELIAALMSKIMKILLFCLPEVQEISISRCQVSMLDTASPSMIFLEDAKKL